MSRARCCPAAQLAMALGVGLTCVGAQAVSFPPRTAAPVGSESRQPASDAATPRNAVALSACGESWTLVSPSPTAQSLRAVAWTGRQIVAVGDGGTIVTSQDGLTWTSRASGTSANLAAVTWAGNQLVAVGGGNGGAVILTSPDGVSWSSRSSPAPAQSSLSGIVWTGALVVAVGGNPTPFGEFQVVLTSPDGIVWTSQAAAICFGSLAAVAWTGKELVAVGCGVATSPDGMTWSAHYLGPHGLFIAVTWTGLQVVAVGSDVWGTGGAVYTSADGVVWDLAFSQNLGGLTGVAWTGSGLVVVGPPWYSGGSATILTSPDGISWTPQTSGTTNALSGVAWAGTQLVAVGGNGTILTNPCAAPAYSSSYWVPVASHTSGLNQSQWRSDLGLLNPGQVAANVQIKLFGSSAVMSAATYVPAGTQSILRDVVGQLNATGSGAVEILSDQPIKVTSRTYNQVPSDASCHPDGTQGQDYPAVAASDGLAAGQSAYLAGLAENASYRCNIGLVNVGSGAATVLVELFSGAGTKLTDYMVPLAAGQWAQETQPFKNKAGQTAMDRAYAKITMQSGSGVFGFASVVDNRTNDPTTVAMQR